MIYKEGEDLVALNFENSVTCNLFHGGVVCAKFAHTTFEVLPRLIKSPYKTKYKKTMVFQLCIFPWRYFHHILFFYPNTMPYNDIPNPENHS